MVYLDTHIVVWLYAGLEEKFSRSAKSLINDNDLYISPIVCLELQYLHEIQRVTDEADTIVTDLSDRIGLMVCERAFKRVVSQAMTLTWTRDPIDRLIVAHASVNGNVLISKDQHILTSYPHARW